MSIYREARTPQSRGKVLDHITVHRAEGGHVVTHHYALDGPIVHRPKEHVFGDNEGEELLLHVAKHMGVQPKEEATEGE